MPTDTQILYLCGFFAVLIIVTILGADRYTRGNSALVVLMRASVIIYAIAIIWLLIYRASN